jgi:hypothetical protein
VACMIEKDTTDKGFGTSATGSHRAEPLDAN